MTPRTVLFVALALLGGAACGDDDTASESTTSTAEVTTTTDGSTATTTAAEGTTADTDGEGTTTDTAGGDVGGELPEACSLVPDAEAVSGLQLGEPVPQGNQRRRTACAFAASEDGDVGLTVGLQSGDRFDRKAEQSERQLGPGEPIDGLGDRALFFFSDDDLPEGVGGMLVEVGDRTLEVTLQGIDEAEMREAATALAELAISNLSS